MRRKLLRVPALITTAITTLALAVVGIASPANAAEIPGAIQNVSHEQREAHNNTIVRADFTISIPDETEPGSTFSLTLPDELTPRGTQPFVLTTPEGVLADAVWSGKTVIFTVTDYVLTHTDIRAEGFISVSWDLSVVDYTERETVYLSWQSNEGNTFSTMLDFVPTVAPPLPPGDRGFAKAGVWTDHSEGYDNPENAIRWLITLPQDNEVGTPEGVLLIENAGPGWNWNCEADMFNGSTPDGQMFFAPFQVLSVSADNEQFLSADRWNWNCEAGVFSIEIFTVNAGERIDITARSGVTDAQLPEYTNTALLIDRATGSQGTTSATVKRSNAGGGGEGNQYARVGGKVFDDRNRNGVFDQGEQPLGGYVLELQNLDGTPVVDALGNEVEPYLVSVATEGYLFSNLTPNRSYNVVFVDEQPTPDFKDGSWEITTPTTRTSILFTTNGEEDLTLDIGVKRHNGAIDGWVWVDTNRNGLYEPELGEELFPNAELTFTTSDRTLPALAPIGRFASSDAWLTTATRNGTIAVTVPDGYTPTTPTVKPMFVFTGPWDYDTNYKVIFGLVPDDVTPPVEPTPEPTPTPEPEPEPTPVPVTPETPSTPTGNTPPIETIPELGANLLPVMLGAFGIVILGLGTLLFSRRRGHIG